MHRFTIPSSHDHSKPLHTTEYDSNGAITRTYGVREYWSVPDKWTIKDHCEDESNRGFACAESDLVYPDTCGCPSCPC